MTDRPRESDPTARPSDAVTGKVVARWKGWSNAFCYPPRPSNPEGKGSWRCEQDDYESDVSIDPRDDTDAALELLHAALREIGNRNATAITPGLTVWILEWMSDMEHDPRLPISGPGFRYAVVRLAARVWGVE